MNDKYLKLKDRWMDEKMDELGDDFFAKMESKIMSEIESKPIPRRARFNFNWFHKIKKEITAARISFVLASTALALVGVNSYQNSLKPFESIAGRQLIEQLKDQPQIASQFALALKGQPMDFDDLDQLNLMQSEIDSDKFETVMNDL